MDSELNICTGLDYHFFFTKLAGAVLLHKGEGKQPLQGKTYVRRPPTDPLKLKLHR
jgi:hypothetical protein